MFRVEIKNCEYGFLYFDLVYNDKRYTIEASSVFNPFYRLKAFLESIILGNEKSEFWLDEEGRIRIFIAELRKGKVIFRVKKWENNKTVMKFEINKDRFVSEFYKAFIIYTSKLDFEYEDVTFEKAFRWLIRENKSRWEMANDLLDFDSDLLNCLATALKYHYNDNSIYHHKNRVKKLIQKQCQKGVERFFLRSFDKGNRYFKLKAIYEWFDELIYEAMWDFNLREFKSDIIENYFLNRAKREFRKDRIEVIEDIVLVNNIPLFLDLGVVLDFEGVREIIKSRKKSFEVKLFKCICGKDCVIKKAKIEKGFEYVLVEVDRFLFNFKLSDLEKLLKEKK